MSKQRKTVPGRPAAEVIDTATLARNSLFEGLDDEALAWLRDNGRVIDLEPGASLLEVGAPAREMWVVLEGTLEIYTDIQGRRTRFDDLGAGRALGILPFSRMKVYRGTATATEPSRVLEIERDRFPAMLEVAPELGARLVTMMSDRVRQSTSQEQQREKMMALGKLSAGLAHELNNPAAAVARDADALGARVKALPKLVAALVAARPDPSTLTALESLLGRESAGSNHDPLARAEREDALGDWLASRDIDDGWLLAETLADAGIVADDLEQLANGDSGLEPLVRWLDVLLATEQLTADIAAAAERITGLVGSIKTYSHMDRNPSRQHADLRLGLDSTLTMLGHRIRAKGIQVTRDYADDLPEVPVYVSEINQVWTNLIDNAIDALSEDGHLRLEIRTGPKDIFVHIADDGSGVPEDLQSRVFEPFFTTKETGRGTGLGLDIVQRILGEHQGEISLESVPGRTVFTVRLPRAAEG